VPPVNVPFAKLVKLPAPPNGWITTWSPLRTARVPELVNVSGVMFSSPFAATALIVPLLIMIWLKLSLPRLPMPVVWLTTALAPKVS
jgi:hypothetical protein